MGKMKNAGENWLEECGYSLGYDWDSLPDSSQWDNIKLTNIYRRTYGRAKSSTNNK